MDANQWTGFYTITASVMKKLTVISLLFVLAHQTGKVLRTCVLCQELFPVRDSL